MSSSSFTNQPTKQYPLDSKVWKLHSVPQINEEPLLTEESIDHIHVDNKRILNMANCQQVNNSLLINNYTIRSVSQQSIVQKDEFEDYAFQNWETFKLPDSSNQE